jgi:hypothetical protein
MTPPEKKDRHGRQRRGDRPNPTAVSRRAEAFLSVCIFSYHLRGKFKLYGRLQRPGIFNQNVSIQ